MLYLEDALDDIPGLLTSMLVAFGKNGIRTIEDLAACATDDLLGWTEHRGEEVTMHPGILGDMAVSRKQCDTIILQARVRAQDTMAVAIKPKSTQHTGLAQSMEGSVAAWLVTFQLDEGDSIHATISIPLTGPPSHHEAQEKALKMLRVFLNDACDAANKFRFSN